jgi:DNA repair exonuclease SbcCD ATPase subunit
MGKKKNDLSEELIHLNANEESAASLNDGDLDLDLSEIELREEGSSKVKENTLRLIPQSPATKAARSRTEDSQSSGEVKVSYGLPAKQQVPRTPEDRQVHGSGQLKQSEHLRIAQNKINDLEEEIIKLRQENEELATAGETFKKLNDEYYASIESLRSKVGDQKLTYSQEVQLLKQINQNKDKQISELKQQLEDYKSRIDNNFQRVRKREKDLEHRLEIAKIEEAAVVKSKDQLILDLKRRIDELASESDNFRRKSQENYQELQKKQQVVRGAVRALRIALTKLEGEDDSDFGLADLHGDGRDES